MTELLQVFVRCTECRIECSNIGGESEHAMVTGALRRMRESCDCKCTSHEWRAVVAEPEAKDHERKLVDVVPLALLDSGARFEFLAVYIAGEFIATTHGEYSSFSNYLDDERYCVQLDSGWLYAAERYQLCVVQVE